MDSMKVDNRFTIGRERINFSDSNYVSKHITQPLRIEEIEILQRCIFIMEHYAIFVQECCCLQNENDTVLGLGSLPR